MKKLILTAIVGLAANFATAQNINFGIKGGAVFNTDKGKVWQDAGNIFKKDGKASAGFQAGALARVSLAGIYIQPELLYTQFKNEYDVDGQKLNVTKKRMDIPVNVGKRFLGIGHIQAGPVFSYYFDDKLSVKDFTTAKQDDFNVGMQIGAGVEVSKLLFDLRYEFGLGKVGSDILNGSNGQYRTENRPQMLNLSVAYLF
ncbi:PorT family protein [Empedobacter falsenii]|uniref:PorT family protein n=1 Tax=Empedobacter falsenii TaxID=343874 RepID=A0AAW7DKL5_9FLAO|nr:MULTISPECIES: porin family protein [Empedobacter]HCC95125.1 PorT family protein [Flavobacteriaceae bacterium]MDH2206230.1 PorT family protein [Empedobacter sp. GD03644]MDM1062375.1 PorT family protein [Empedobacter falsenii]MDM1547659.1 PorT family protein [Empedobacter falsenii]MDM1552080.1 PorT family protein [Empedobacter falsenii]